MVCRVDRVADKRPVAILQCPEPFAAGLRGGITRARVEDRHAVGSGPTPTKGSFAQMVTYAVWVAGSTSPAVASLRGTVP